MNDQTGRAELGDRVPDTVSEPMPVWLQRYSDGLGFVAAGAAVVSLIGVMIVGLLPAFLVLTAQELWRRLNRSRESQ